ncbi:MAG: glycosyltransferase [Dehalococcoidia bacterium]|nr:glycosyltransferase [Dehalococcoidia bacterium]
MHVRSFRTPKVPPKGDNLLQKALRLMLGEMLLSWGVLRYWRATDVFATYLSDGASTLPLLLARLLGRRILIVYTGSCADSLASAGSLKFRTAARFAAALSDMEYSLSDWIAVLSLTECANRRLAKHRFKIERLAGADSSFIAGNSYVDFRAFSVGPLPRQRPPTVAFVGRLMPEKGALEFGVGAAQLLETLPDLEVVVCGDGPLRGELTRALSLAFSPGKMSVRGAVSHQEVAEVLRHVRFVVVPSLTEVVAAVAVEAMACGAICCATPVGATPDVVINGVTGFVIPTPGAADIRDTVLRAWASPDLDGIQLRAGQFAVEHFTFEAVQRRWRRALQRMSET